MKIYKTEDCQKTRKKKQKLKMANNGTSNEKNILLFIITKMCTWPR